MGRSFGGDGRGVLVVKVEGDGAAGLGKGKAAVGQEIE